MIHGGQVPELVDLMVFLVGPTVHVMLILMPYIVHFRYGASSAKATNFSKNCPEAHCAWNGTEVTFNLLWVQRFEETGK